MPLANRCRRRRLLSLTAVLALSFLPAARGQFIRLEDVVAGGDGSGNAPAGNTGVSPLTGAFTTDYVPGRIFDTDGVNPSPVPGSPYIDSVFVLAGRVPTAEDGCNGCFVQYISQTDVQLWLDDSEWVSSTWNYILKDRNGGVSEPGIHVGGRNTFTSAIGIHAAAGITFDLDALRARHGDDAVDCFSTFQGLDSCATGFALLLAMVSDETRVLDVRNSWFSANQGSFLSMEIPPEARFLTLVTAASGDDNCDHGTFARPVITPAGCPVLTDTWIWRVSPSRVIPGEQIVIEGESLNVVLQLGGVALVDQHLDSLERVTARVPQLPNGVYDLVALEEGFGTFLARLPDAIEIVPRPVLTSVIPQTVAANRATFVEINGRNLRPDMSVFIDTTGTVDGPGVPLIDQQYLSPTLITGYAPPLPSFLQQTGLGPKTIVLADQGRFYSFPGLIRYVREAIDSVTPETIATTGGEELTFSGAGFEPEWTPRLGGVPLTEPIFVDAATFRGFALALPPGLHDADILDEDDAVRAELSGAVEVVVEPPPGPPPPVLIGPDRRGLRRGDRTLQLDESRPL